MNKLNNEIENIEEVLKAIDDLQHKLNTLEYYKYNDYLYEHLSKEEDKLETTLATLKEMNDDEDLLKKVD